MSLPVDVVVMAAGKGTRMKSQRPKVLHRLGGRALAQHVIDCAAGLSARSVVVITGHGAERVEAGLTAPAATALRFVRQEPQLGTGHAVQQAVPVLADDGVVLVLNGDVPLIEPDTLRELIAACAGQHLALLSVDTGEDASGYGRIVRAADAGRSVRAIVEHKDANAEQRRLTEWYSGVMAAPAALLKPLLARLTNDNSQGEYYLTDVVKHAVAEGREVRAIVTGDAVQVAGVNSPQQLAELERAYQRRLANRFMADGVRLADPARFDVRGELVCGQDVEIDVNTVFEGRVELGDGVRIGANCVIANARIGAGAVIHPFTHIDGEAAGVRVGPGALVGPFARLRPGADLGAEVHIGNFVEVKNSTLAAGAKANHLAYLGDATVGERVNYGAGSITANYDGANKHRTVIEADVHVGSNCVLVAPVTIGAGGTVGAGSTITKSTEPGALAVARGRQASIAGWARPKKAPKAS
ncbi:MAG: UDP-N-acetylglucosamine diphosphorylase/glucosamine-1-phosphate N-acetyltransferase [Comamonadaceae bacterium]|jgi:bifunctional UDP-N-acetylglucosamine pyrophosphorylase/glucosamine-1-phosphate N-acetyltransferase|uniref:Bifunctional protein GlmU n=1 Tax=Hydrogenophaga borbori TaxID=2294117 RepID=A0A372EJZ9_9BURK|nr:MULTISPECIES: bifunctional UDP-N-acetylglucosamine diphosphorylase/glucosamine-1-phosphate N-acetyltransferase GlmU [Hydrogenophaga]NCT97975.1 UDP-N-acetylglucosamine diphosphorylase/glucosamine-1-phosphate N-acetyltransferase [Comamonadaceae bacterium]RFP79230.1 UDP-N-acetylglucosamine diphosphorylase/glucosamine-1-phosphate N-acetyltransferase [Hydrogenophaga borbori]WQB84249.1 bifunctional UDP-N-acetylglucosamine diphosphorylase/glucosamine-1-phosphate N-acetyltransferase GlmU [Hydrogenoph